MSPRQVGQFITWLCLPMAFGLAWVACGMNLMLPTAHRPDPSADPIA